MENPPDVKIIAQYFAEAIFELADAGWRRDWNLRHPKINRARGSLKGLVEQCSEKPSILAVQIMHFDGDGQVPLIRELGVETEVLRNFVTYMHDFPVDQKLHPLEQRMLFGIYCNIARLI